MPRLITAILVVAAVGTFLLREHLPGASAPKERRSALGRKTWPTQVGKVEIPCSDGAQQSAMWYAPTATEKKPLLVGLHTWSSTYASAGGDAVYAEWCIAQGWAFVHPDFRGPNHTPLSMGSDRAVQDIVEAVAWAKTQTAIDDTRIYLIGVSGGGHMAQLMAGRHPEIWAAVSAWCGISDIAQWHADHLKAGKPDTYAKNIEDALGHAPSLDDPDALKRSPVASLSAAVNLPLDINHGIHDGRTGSVPFIHSLRAFNAVVPEPARLDAAAFQPFYDSQKLPSGWANAAPDASYAMWPPVYRHQVGSTRVTLFEGTHQIVHQAALNCLAAQRKGAPAVWTLPTFIPVDTGESESGK